MPTIVFELEPPIDTNDEPTLEETKRIEDGVIKAILNGRRRVLPINTFYEGEYTIEELSIVSKLHAKITPLGNDAEINITENALLNAPSKLPISAVDSRKIILEPGGQLNLGPSIPDEANRRQIRLVVFVEHSDGGSTTSPNAKPRISVPA